MCMLQGAATSTGLRCLVEERPGTLSYKSTRKWCIADNYALADAYSSGFESI